MNGPAVGDRVFFHPSSNSTKHGFEPTAVCAAIVAKVLSDGRLNLAAFDGNGVNHSMTDVPFLAVDETTPEHGYYAEWHSDAMEGPQGAVDSQQNT